MESRRSGRPGIIIIIILLLTCIGVSFVTVNHFNNEIEIYRRSKVEADNVFDIYSPDPFINSAADAEPYRYENHRDDALYFFDAPEGFTIISHSAAWNSEMLQQLHLELLRNEHGEEINVLYEIIIYPHEEEEGSLLASYTLGTTAIHFIVDFPAFPPDFVINFPMSIGRINLYGGDTNTTIQSMANSLSHEYGHLYTFHYMFGSNISADDSLDETYYARLREARRFDLITSAGPGERYMQDRHRYLFEIAAEDYVQLMGSPTTRTVVDFIDIRQFLNGAQHPPSITGSRNAFPQENMMIPLANDVSGLDEYFYGFIGREPRVPVEPKQDVILNIERNSVHHNLVSGPRTFIYYEITWNTPYNNAVYTLVFYDPDDYSGWGTPVKTVRPGGTASAIIGEYVVNRGDQIVSLNDNFAEGTKVFFVVAMLPDGTYYLSEKLFYTF